MLRLIVASLRPYGIIGKRPPEAAALSSAWLADLQNRLQSLANALEGILAICCSVKMHPILLGATRAPHTYALMSFAAECAGCVTQSIFE